MCNHIFMKSENDLHHQSTEASTSFRSSNPFKSFIFVFGIVLLILAPTINVLTNPNYIQDLYSNAPYWYTPWAVLAITSQTIILTIAFVHKKKLWIYIFLLLTGVETILEITILKPIDPTALFTGRLLTIALLFLSVKSKWRLFS